MYGIIVFVTAIIVIIATSLLKSVDFNKQTKSLIAVIVSVIAGAVAAVIQNGGFEDFTKTGLIGTILMVYGIATAIYQLVIPESVDSAISKRLVKPKKLKDLSKSSEVHIPGEFSE